MTNALPSISLSPREITVYKKYAGLALPRHTSYPTANVWGEASPLQVRAGLTELAATRRPISLYIHVPYCQSLCYYCACTKEIIDPETMPSDPRESYLAALETEAARVGALLSDNPVAQIHLGGGTPTFLTPAQLRRLLGTLSRHFSRAEDVEFSVEIDPRVTTREHLALLAEHGLNRVSLGVQDFEPTVQNAVNRVQPPEMIKAMMADCRALGIASINFDLIYGLPFQTVATMSATLDKVVELSPDRIAFYRLAVIPSIFKWQRRFTQADLPEGEEALALNLLALGRLTEAGYEFIGLDHFAKPSELLSQAVRDGTIRRNFQGMTTGGRLAVIGLGPSAITQTDGMFSQNVKKAPAWRSAAAIDFPVTHGKLLSAEDRLRSDVLERLYCFGRIDKRDVEAEFGIEFDRTFASELSRLTNLVDDGLVTLSASEVALRGLLGRLLVRVVAAVFDAYLPVDAYRTGISPEAASRVG